MDTVDQNTQIEDVLSSLNLMELFLQIMTDPSEVRGQIKVLKDRLDPLIESICSTVVDYVEDYANNCDRFVGAKAQMAKKTLDAYINAGFAPEQAMALLINDKRVIREALKNAKIDLKQR